MSSWKTARDVITRSGRQLLDHVSLEVALGADDEGSDCGGDVGSGAEIRKSVVDKHP